MDRSVSWYLIMINFNFRGCIFIRYSDKKLNRNMCYSGFIVRNIWQPRSVRECRSWYISLTFEFFMIFEVLCIDLPKWLARLAYFHNTNIATYKSILFCVSFWDFNSNKPRRRPYQWGVRVTCTVSGHCFVRPNLSPGLWHREQINDLFPCLMKRPTAQSSAGLYITSCSTCDVDTQIVFW